VSFTAFSRLKGAYEDRFEKKPDSMTNFALGALAAGIGFCFFLVLFVVLSYIVTFG
jgi:hypothetical protein